MRRWHFFLSALLVFMHWQAVFGQEGIEVTTRLDKTAFYVGEPVLYQVSVRYPESIEFILERLQEKNLRMDPFDIRKLSHSFRRVNGVRTLTVKLELVTYEISQEQWQVPAFDLFLVRRDAPLDELGESRVETLQIPAQPIAFRSTLPGESIQIRDTVETRSFAGRLWASSGAGVLLLGLLLAPVAARRLLGRKVAEEGSARPERSQMRRQLAEKIQACRWDVREEEALVALYGNLALLLREYAGFVAERRGGSLSGNEIGSALSGREEESVVEWITELVQLADQVRYSPQGVQQGRSRLDEVRQKTLEMLGRP